MEISIVLEPNPIQNIIKGLMSQHSGKVLNGEMIDSLSVHITESINNYLLTSRQVVVK